MGKPVPSSQREPQEALSEWATLPPLLSSLTQALVPWVHPCGLPHSFWKHLLLSSTDS